MFADATKPRAADKSISVSGVERVIAHRHLLPLNRTITETFVPVENIVDLDATSGYDTCRALVGRRQCQHSELFVVCDEAYVPSPAVCLPTQKGRAWRLAQ